MKERGIIFNGEMVRALLDGRKTQTRRILKVQPDEDGLAKVTNGPWMDTSEREYRCPFGVIGDRIWVRETWALLGNEDGCCVDWNDNLCKGDEKTAARIYRASCEQKPGDYGLWSIPDNAYWKPYTENEKFEGSWRPSIHMPRWASRILLEITDVRMERLNSISEQDALSEGIDRERLEESQDNYDCIADHNMTGRPTATGAFKYLWESIYGEENWQANPWVWVIEFNRIEGGAA